MIWGIFPIDPKISYESHLLGLIAGVVLSFIYKNDGPPIEKHAWEEDEEDSDEISDEQNEPFTYSNDSLNLPKNP